ncbi:hypothetical protein [Salidesulfovibrio onnuriiensis]|uniref:hypothetical protein n=1 Tax=Salidesulfovibrio onnuriiensis TaxID=2583823 RepID=UPI0011C93FC5|nr:hypothetical protein [Salidesulfovibrio onnuriiensis]
MREDNLRARLEGFGRPTMSHRLKVLGYLVIHTRQVDMIMTDARAVARLRTKIMNDLARLEPEKTPEPQGMEAHA